MPLIRDIVQQAFSTHLLTLEAEDQLRCLLQTKYEKEDFRAFMALQYAAMTGSVLQESRLQFAASSNQRLLHTLG